MNTRKICLLVLVAVLSVLTSVYAADIDPLGEVSLNKGGITGGGKQEFTVSWTTAGGPDVSSFEVSISVRRTNNSTDADLKTLSANKRDTVFKFNADPPIVSAGVTITTTIQGKANCITTFFPQLPPETNKAEFIDILSAVPQTPEPGANKQPFVVSWAPKTVRFIGPFFKNYKVQLDVVRADNTTGSDKASASGNETKATLKIKGSGPIKSSKVTITGDFEKKFTRNSSFTF